MRRLNRKKALTLVKELDAFPKVPESCVEPSASGGTVSLLAFSLIAFLTFLEFMVFRNTWMTYEYEVDKDFRSKMRINMDITVAMRCNHIGADVVDVAESMSSSEGLKYDPVNFELSPPHRLWHMTLEHLQDLRRVEHSLQDVFFKSEIKRPPPDPPQSDEELSSLSSCRIHGHIDVNKVAGNFHITVGKSFPNRRGHAHLSALVTPDSYNFSHRIDHLSFGEEVEGIIGALDGTEKVTPVSEHMFQYFLTIVPTKLNTFRFSADTHQFSVTEWSRVINPVIGYHGVSGIFMKYDISSLMVKVTEQHMPIWKFLVRLCGIIGGIFSTTGMIHAAMGFLVDCFCCRFRKESSDNLKDVPVAAQEPSDASAPTVNCYQ